MGINYHIYNKSSYLLEDIEDNSIDYVITSPPYNIGHEYFTYVDKLSFSNFLFLYKNILRSVSRVLKSNGVLVVDIADVIIMEDKIVFAADLVDFICQQLDLTLLYMHPYIVKENTQLSTKNDLYFNRLNKQKCAHSNCEQILCFAKRPTQQFKTEFLKKIQFKTIYEYEYLDNNAFWPLSLVQDLLAVIDIPNSIVLDPFMGSGRIGKCVLQMGGKFIGYDVDKKVLQKYEWRYE